MKTNVVTLMSAKKAHMIARLTQHAYTMKVVMTATVLMVFKVMNEMTSDNEHRVNTPSLNVHCCDTDYAFNVLDKIDIFNVSIFYRDVHKCAADDNDFGCFFFQHTG